MKFDIDLVYMWVDSNDPNWQAKRTQYAQEQTSNIAENTSTARWRNNDELRYSLRSVEIYAPWIHHIFIITDNQCPAWLDTNNPKVTIVDHREILPSEALPTFNSMAIESALHKIANLSEYFILANDDLIFTRKVSPTDFFDSEGRPIVRLRHFKRNHPYPAGSYHSMIKRMQDIAHDKTGKLIPLSPHHCFDAYRKSQYEYCINNINAQEWIATAHSRFRHANNMQRCYIDYHMIATKHAIMRKVHRYNRISSIWQVLRALATNRYAIDSRYISFATTDYKSILHTFNPLMVCVNDDENTTDEDCNRMSEFLSSLFPNKSSFEN